MPKPQSSTIVGKTMSSSDKKEIQLQLVGELNRLSVMCKGLTRRLNRANYYLTQVEGAVVMAQEIDGVSEPIKESLNNIKRLRLMLK